MATLTCKQAVSPKSHDFIYLEIRNNNKYLEKVAELYRSGHSLRDIAKQMDLSKTKIRDLVLCAGIPLRTMRGEKGRVGVRNSGQACSQASIWVVVP